MAERLDQDQMVAIEELAISNSFEIAEFPVVLECRLLHTIEIGLHTQFIGEIIDVKGDESVLVEDGYLDIMRIQPLIYDTSHKGYHGVTPCIGKAFSVGKELQK